MTKDKFSAEVSGLCPCGGTFAAGRNPPNITHSMPPCQDFFNRVPDDYLKFCREWSAQRAQN